MRERPAPPRPFGMRDDARMTNFDPALFGDWDGTPAGARALQCRLATQLRLEDDWPRPLRRVAGFDVGFEDQGRITRAAVVVLDATRGTLLEHHIARVPTRMPYVPGLLSFRELPALMAALDCLQRPPDLAFVDGHGIAHPRRLGIAAHFGLASGLPSLGVAKQRLAGQHPPLPATPGARVPLSLDGEQVSWVLCSKRHCRPLFVSPGHRVSLAGALTLTQRFLAGYRLPEPTRLADRLASRRGPLPAIGAQAPSPAH